MVPGPLQIARFVVLVSLPVLCPISLSSLPVDDPPPVSAQVRIDKRVKHPQSEPPANDTTARLRVDVPLVPVHVSTPLGAQ
jgi:hypothetical protein